MQKIDSESSLREAIIQLENQRAFELILLKEQFNETYESIKPVSLIKSIFHEAAESDDFKENLISTSVGLTAGYLSKLLFQGLTRNPLKKMAGTALMFGITKIVAKNPEAVRSVGKKVFQFLRSKSAHKIKLAETAGKE